MGGQSYRDSVKRKRSQFNGEMSEHGKEAGFDPSKDWKALRGTEHNTAPPEASLLARGI